MQYSFSSFPSPLYNNIPNRESRNEIISEDSKEKLKERVYNVNEIGKEEVDQIPDRGLSALESPAPSTL